MKVPADWLERLPDAVALAAKEWDLELGDPFQPGGQCSWVAPVIGADQVLKVGWLHEEAMHEVDQLRLWDGDGAVRVHESAVDGDTVLMLLERCIPGTSLKAVPEPEQDVLVAEVLQRMWRPGQPPFRPLWAMCAMWVDAMAPTALDPGLVRTGMQLFVELAAGDTLLLTDLHADNILAAAREPWLVIDPKP
ncbi:MAG: Streptomycin 6-kinase, partial [Frankiales bacterium]|nr:Streptomycin 6-kinase [Frankiales bacterium]